MPTVTPGPNQLAGDIQAARPYLDKVTAVLDGAEAIRKAGQAYLPKMVQETDVDYKYRLNNAKFTNIFRDIIENLASKPFAEEVQLSDEGASDRIKALVEDIDGRGNNLHVFAASTFFSGLANAVDWILVDYTQAVNTTGRVLTAAEEQAQGLRPYWVHVPQTRMIAAYSGTVGGKEVPVHIRFREDVTVRSGYGEVTKERVRIFDRAPIMMGNRVVGYSPATWSLMQKKENAAGLGLPDWEQIGGGAVDIGIIPMVPFVTGRRKGSGYRFQPMLNDALDIQIEHYQQETGLKSIKELTAYAMLAGNGVAPAMEGGKVAPVPVGPRSVLYAPPSGESGNHGEWVWIEPSAENIRFLAEDVKNTEKQLREIGRQPLTADSGNLTVITTAFAAQKGNSAIKAAALNLKDALEQAFVMTSKWLKEDATSEVRIYTDFDVGNGDAATDQAALTAMRENGDLSRETLWEERKRRGTLSADFDPERERERLIEEMPDPDSGDDLTSALPDPQNDPVDDPADDSVDDPANPA